MRMYV